MLISSRCCCCCWVLRHSLTSQVINVAFYIEREKFDKFCLEALISAWVSFTCRKSTTRDQWPYFPSEGSHNQDFYALKNPSTAAGIEPANLGSSGEYVNHWTTEVENFVTDITFQFFHCAWACLVHSIFSIYPRDRNRRGVMSGERAGHESLLIILSWNTRSISCIKIGWQTELSNTDHK